MTIDVATKTKSKRVSQQSVGGSMVSMFPKTRRVFRATDEPVEEFDEKFSAPEKAEETSDAFL
jgi:hypothetical protein